MYGKKNTRGLVDYYLRLLNEPDLSTQRRKVVTKLLIEEEDQLGHDLEHLEFAELRAAACRDRVEHQRRLRDRFVAGSTDWVQAERLLANFEAISQLIEGLCGHMRKAANTRAL